MRAIKTHELTPNSIKYPTELLWVYNGLDACVTTEVLDVIKPQLDNQTRSTYEFSKSLQGPILEMRLRGIRVDEAQRLRTVNDYQIQMAKLSSNLDRMVKEGIGVQTGVNFNSPLQVKNLFYGVLGLPPVKKRNSKGIFAPSVDRESLERLESHFLAQPLISHILGLRDINKKIGVLKTAIDPDGRMRTSYNIAGTTTGRLSSSLSDFGTGTNLQNIEQRLRQVFIADEGMKFAYIDLEQAESRLVGAIEWNLFHDPTYLDACESGDLHTTVCRLAWGSLLKWTGDIKSDRDLADQPFYRQHSYRHMAKVLGHGTNYNGKPNTMAKHTKLDARLIEQFQERYFGAFPAHRLWHDWVRSAVHMDGYLDTLTGRRRWFFGRRDDDTTVREAIAYDPQGSVGDILNLGMLQVWRLNICQLLLQVHDAILIQYPEQSEDETLPKVLKAIQVPISLRHNRTLLIPAEAKTGWNWSDQIVDTDKDSPTYGKVIDNFDGLMKYKGNDSRTRSANSTPVSLLDRRVSQL